MTNLTEQWKKGELESGYYYIVVKQVEFPNRIDFYNSSLRIGSYHSTDEIKEVLAPVPSYEQWQKHRKTLLKTQEKNCDLEIINAQLKELLKEIRQQITRLVFGSPEVQIFEGTFDNKLLAKIDQVLGEK